MIENLLDDILGRHLCGFSFVLNIRRLNLTHACLFVAFLYLAITAKRNVAVFAMNTS